jgi:hypothetical protein
MPGMRKSIADINQGIIGPSNLQHTTPTAYITMQGHRN